MAVIASSVVAAPAAAAVTASLEGGVLTVDDDGASTDLLVAPYSDPRPGEPPFYMVYPKDARTGQPTDARAGAGCRQEGSVAVCPSAPVQSILVRAGDGDDQLSIGGNGSGGPGTIQTCFVPATVDAGGGNDRAGVSCTGQPAVLHGGDGNDQLSAAATASSVQEDGGPGDDGLGVGGTGEAPIGPIHPGSVALDGGPGNDSLGYRGQGGATLLGGDGNDAVNAWGTTEPVDARGDAGDDTMMIMENRGPVLADAGDGDDKLFVSRMDVDQSRVGGGIVDARAGAGDDTLLVGDDGDRDLIDCGPGNDHFTFYVEGAISPPKENRYTRCPIIGARLLGTTKRSADGGALVFDFRSPEPGTVRLHLLGPRSRLAHVSARLRRGRTLVRVRLSRALRKHLGSRYGKFVVAQAAIRSRTGDVQPLQRAIRVARS